MNHLLFYCRPGFEKEMAAEIQDKAVKLDVNEICTDVGMPCQPTQQIYGAFYNAPRTVGARVSMKF